jgi:hypothetical protein
MLTILRYGTFLDVYRRNWSDILHFRSRNLFTTCEVCFALKQALQQKDSSLDARLTALKQYRAHLHSQYCDRSVIWKLQAESAEPNSGVLLISTDGLDQSKFALPREPELRNNAALNLASKITYCFFGSHFLFLTDWYDITHSDKSHHLHAPTFPNWGRSFSGPVSKYMGHGLLGIPLTSLYWTRFPSMTALQSLKFWHKPLRMQLDYSYIDFFRVQLAENLDPRLGMF